MTADGLARSATPASLAIPATGVGLARLLADGVPVAGDRCAVRRAWPADLADPARGYVLELQASDGRVLGARLCGNELEIVADDPVLPEITGLVADGWRVLAHRAGKRAVLRRDERGSFRKLATPKATRRAVARADAVERLLERAPGVPRPPARTAVDPDAGSIDLAPAPGRSLRSVLADGPAEADGVLPAEVGRRLGETLAALATVEPARSADLDALPRHTLADEAATLDRWVGAACALAPVGRPAAERLRAEADDLIGALRRAPETPSVLGHRDLHDGQILVSADTGLTILDWDTAAWTDPCLDLANLLAHLDLLVTLTPSAAAATRAAASAMVAAVAAGGHPAASHPDRLDLLRRGAALRIHAVHAFRRRPRAPGTT